MTTLIVPTKYESTAASAAISAMRSSNIKPSVTYPRTPTTTTTASTSTSTSTSPKSQPYTYQGKTRYTNVGDTRVLVSIYSIAFRNNSNGLETHLRDYQEIEDNIKELIVKTKKFNHLAKKGENERIIAEAVAILDGISIEFGRMNGSADASLSEMPLYSSVSPLYTKFMSEHQVICSSLSTLSTIIPPQHRHWYWGLLERAILKTTRKEIAVSPTPVKDNDATKLSVERAYESLAASASMPDNYPFDEPVTPLSTPNLSSIKCIGDVLRYMSTSCGEHQVIRPITDDELLDSRIKMRACAVEVNYGQTKVSMETASTIYGLFELMRVVWKARILKDITPGFAIEQVDDVDDLLEGFPEEMWIITWAIKSACKSIPQDDHYLIWLVIYTVFVVK